METDEQPRTPTKRLIRGTFSFTILCLLTFIPYQKIYKPAAVDLQIPESASIIQVQEDNIPSEDPDLKNNKPEQLFNQIIVEAANKNEIDPALVKAIIKVESSYNHLAVSKKGARGLMQIMPSTAMELGVTDLFNPETNVNAGVRHLKRLLKEFGGDLHMALAAYNAGSTKVREYQGVPPFSTTQSYVKKVFEYYKYYQNMRLTSSKNI
ncbi:MAG: lytic transglycosylase domain-containing protein [Deltaproteobacteria bacterium]|nr:lytic transglycosylase domain-containing protein [Deltaproteobacteria bacterium]